MHQVKVINRNKEAISDRFDGLLYTFPPGEKGVNMPLDAAEHIFGVEFPMNAEECASEAFREQVWKHVQKRWGFNSTPTRKELDAGNGTAKLSVGAKIFKNLAFIPVEMRTVEIVANNDELPLPRGAKEDIEVETDDEEVA